MFNFFIFFFISLIKTYQCSFSISICPDKFTFFISIKTVNSTYLKNSLSFIVLSSLKACFFIRNRYSSAAKSFLSFFKLLNFFLKFFLRYINWHHPLQYRENVLYTLFHSFGGTRTLKMVLILKLLVLFFIHLDLINFSAPCRFSQLYSLVSLEFLVPYNR